MTGTPTPSRSRAYEASGHAPVDGADLALLSEARAGTLTAAQIETVLERMRAQRAELAALAAELEARASTGDLQLDLLNVVLRVQAGRGLSRIDRIIGLAAPAGPRA